VNTQKTTTAHRRVSYSYQDTGNYFDSFHTIGEEK
jgi:hypothetical protein